jgi:hypothetical protein
MIAIKQMRIVVLWGMKLNFVKLIYMNLKKQGILLALLFLLTSNLAGAQSKNIEKTAQEIEIAANTLIHFFSQKKDNKNSNNAKNSVSSNENFGLFKAGSLSKTVKYIECDYMEPFNRGSAIIRNGTSYGLINAKGDFIVPFGKYSGITTDTRDGRLGGNLMETGFFYATYKDPAGKPMACFLNAQGKKVLEITNLANVNFQVSIDRKFLLSELKSLSSNSIEEAFVAIAQDGKKFNLSHFKNYTKTLETVFADSMLIYGDKIGDKILFGFKNLHNKIIVKPSYNMIQPFSDGVAIIGKLDDLGRMRYGIIDKTGKVNLEPIFQNRPHSFSHGISMVQSTAGFEDRAYVDRYGKVILQHTKDLSVIYGSVRRKVGSYFFSKDAVIDTLGNIQTKANFLKAFRINQYTIPGLKAVNFDFDIKSTDGQLHLEFYFSNERMRGIFNLKENKIIYGDFDKNENARSLMLDPISNLIYTIVNLPNSKILEGYMNTNGQFTILKKPTAYTGL